jgi:hypothetical protein
MPLDEALDRATMRLHAEEGTAEAGKINDVIGKDAFDEAQRAPASPNLAQPATGIGQGGAATKEQARPDGEHAPGDSAAQGGDAAGGKAIGGEGAGISDNRAQFRDELISAAAKGENGDQGPASDMPASGGGQFAAPLPDGRNFRVAREGISPPAPPEGFVANAADFAKSIPYGLVGGISSALSATGAANYGDSALN